MFVAVCHPVQWLRCILPTEALLVVDNLLPQHGETAPLDSSESVVASPCCHLLSVCKYQLGHHHKSVINMSNEPIMSPCHHVTMSLGHWSRSEFSKLIVLNSVQNKAKVRRKTTSKVVVFSRAYVYSREWEYSSNFSYTHSHAAKQNLHSDKTHRLTKYQRIKKITIRILVGGEGGRGARAFGQRPH